MDNINSILIAYDFSECSKKALQEAVYLAKKNQAKLNLVQVLDASTTHVFGASLTEKWKENVLQDIHESIKSLDGVTEIDINQNNVTVELGTPYKKIILKAIEVQADLIILGSHGRTMLGYALLGSVADKVARLSPVPVLICNKDHKEHIPEILVPLDVSEQSETAIEPAKKFAKMYHSQIQLLHATNIDEYYHLQFLEMIAKVKEKEYVRLTDLNKKHAFNLKPIIAEGSASHAIIHSVKENKNIGLVVMMTHGNTGLKQFLLGSTTEAVVRYAHCNVLTIPTEEHSNKIHSMKEHFQDKNVTMGNVLI